MQQSVALLCLVLVGGVYGMGSDGSSSRTLQASAKVGTKSSASSTGGYAGTSAAAKSTGGSATAVAQATSEAFASVESKVEEYFETVSASIRPKRPSQSKEDYCDSAIAVVEKEVESVGKITASAYTDALAEVDVQGTGEACASAESEAQAQASGFSKIIAEAIAQASFRTTKASAEAAVEVEIAGITQAFSSAFGKACIRGTGSAMATQTTFANAIVSPIVSVSLAVFASVDCSDTDAYAESVARTAASVEEKVEAGSEGKVTILGEGTGASGGKAGAVATELKNCRGVYKICCSADRFVKEQGKPCDCSKKAGKRARCNAHYIDVDATVTIPYYFDDSKDEAVACKCLKSVVIIT